MLIKSESSSMLLNGYSNISGVVKSSMETIQDITENQAYSPADKLKNGRLRCPYGENADASGTIVYRGVVFNCDSARNRLCLGDVRDPKKCLSIRLSSGSLVVNTDNLGSLSEAIGMFSPEDVNLIMRAINEYEKIKDKLNEIEDDKMNVGQKDSKTTDNDKKDIKSVYEKLKKSAENSNKYNNIDYFQLTHKMQNEENKKHLDNITEDMISELLRA